MAHLDAGDIGNGVEQAGRAADREREVALPGFLRLEDAGKREDGSQQKEE